MRKYQIELTGQMPILMHADDIEWADKMDAWKADKKTKKVSKAGDDRSPAWRWVGSCYHDGEQLVIPTDNIMRALMEGGAQVPVPGVKGNKTFKSQSQSGIIPDAVGWPLLVNGRAVAWAPIAALIGNGDFSAHQAAAMQLGFELYLKRARIGQAKHVRVRPRFDSWQCAGTLIVTDDQITAAVLADILDVAGRYKGLGDWRPSSKTPGTFGTFSATVTQV